MLPWTRVKATRILANHLRHIPIALLTFGGVQLPSLVVAAEAPSMTLAGKIRFDCDRGSLFAEATVCNKTSQMAKVESSIINTNGQPVYGQRSVIQAGGCVSIEAPLETPFSSHYSTEAIITQLAGSRTRMLLPLPSLSAEGSPEGSAAALGLCFIKGASLEQITQVAHSQGLNWKLFPSADGITCGCLETPYGLESIIKKRLEEKNAYSFSMPVRTRLLGSVPVTVKDSVPISPLSPVVIERHRIGPLEISIPRLQGSFPGEEIHIAAAYTSVGTVSASTQKISDSVLDAAILGYFRSYYAGKAAVIPGPFFSTVNVGWLQGQVLTGRKYWERLQFHVAYKIENARIELALIAEGWYNSGAPTPVGEKPMGPEGGEEELSTYATSRLSDVIKLVQGIK